LQLVLPSATQEMEQGSNEKPSIKIPSSINKEYPNIPFEHLGAKLIQQGAEARVFQMNFLGNPTIVKERFVKNYRHPVLDQKLTTRRLHSEARCLARCAKYGVETPTVYFVDVEGRKLYTEYVDGITVKQQLFAGISEQESGVLADKIGHALALLHQKAGVIHGDLTTSNMIIKKTTASLVVIDFGLSCVSSLTEDKAVDLYVLERAFFEHTSQLRSIVSKYFEFV